MIAVRLRPLTGHVHRLSSTTFDMHESADRSFKAMAGRTRPSLAPALFAALWLAASPPAAGAQDGPAPPPSPLTLEDALRYAADHYPGLRAAAEEIGAAAANVSVARTAYLPRLDALWQSNRGTVNNITGPLLPQSVVPSISGPPLAATSASSVWGSAAGALLSWEPFDLGLRGASVQEAEAAVTRARAGQALTRLQVQQAVGIAYLGVLAARQAALAAEADVARRETLARTARTLADAELRPGADASRADAERAAAQTRAIQARQAVVVAEALLGRALGSDRAPTLADSQALSPACPTTRRRRTTRRRTRCCRCSRRRSTWQPHAMPCSPRRSGRGSCCRAARRPAAAAPARMAESKAAPAACGSTA